MDDIAPQTPQLQFWLERMGMGDEAARDELFRQVCKRLERLACKMLKRFPHVSRWTETDDVLQNAIIRLLRTLQTLKPTSMRVFYGLAAQAIRRELIDLVRHYYGPEGLGSNHDSGAWEHEPTAAEADPADTAEAAELEKWYRFHLAVEQLPTLHREVVSLIFYHGWTQVRVAELFQVTERTVRRHWQEAVRQLRQALTGQFLVGE